MPLILRPSGRESTSLPVLPNCNACGARSGCKTPIQRTPQTRADVVFVVNEPPGDFPGSLVAADHPELARYCARVGFPLAGAAVIPVAACVGAGPEAWKHCQPLLGTELARLRPKLVIPFGPEATSTVVGKYWGTSAEIQERWYGYMIPERSLNAWICPIGLANPGARNPTATNTWLYRWLRQAAKRTTRPWTGDAVSPASRVKTLFDRDQIEDVLTRAMRARAVAFDYETTGLKPEWACHKIVSMGLAWTDEDSGEIEAYAFLMHPDLEDAVKAFLVSPVKKIAANLKFEDRWSRHTLGVQVRNWFWDTMEAAHWENPYKGTKGLKFQAFVRLGVPYFADSVDKYFESSGNSTVNQIFHAPVGPLLTYNAMDAVTELLLASWQMVHNGILPKHIVPSKYLPVEPSV